MLEVTVYPISMSAYTSQIYAGLFDLEAAGNISLRFSGSPRHQIEERNGAYGFADNPHVLHLDLQDSVSGQNLSICYDMMDSAGISSMSGLIHCDAYFKRSYLQTFLDSDDRPWAKENPHYTDRIFPYGLNYPCSSVHQNRRWLRTILFARATHVWNRLSARQLARMALDLTLNRNADDGGYQLDSKQLEVSPDAATLPQVLLQTRLFKSAGRPDVDQVEAFNEYRINVTRLLKSHFGSRFVGGIFPDDQAKKRCPDILTQLSTERPDYLRLVRDSRVVVFTRGLADSIGWRLPELLASSKAVVAEPLSYELPEPLVDGKHIAFFSSAEQCVERAEALLNDEPACRALRQSAHDYYQSNTGPASIIGNTLTTALQWCGRTGSLAPGRRSEIEVDPIQLNNEATSGNQTRKTG